MKEVTKLEELERKIVIFENTVSDLTYRLNRLTDFIYNYFYNNYGLVSDEEFDKLKGLL